MRPRTRLLTGLAAVAGFAAAATISGLDRASESRPALANWVPQPFRVDAARALARQQLTDGQPVSAALDARRAIARDPSDARSVGLYGAAQQLAGKLAGARRAFTVSGAMGWREPLTQLYWMSVAFNEGNFRVASQRLDAILRQSPNYPGHVRLLAEFEAYPAGRDELARRLADRPGWRDVYFAESYGLSPSSQIMRADVARRLAQARNGRDCPLVAPLTMTLAQATEYATAHMVWQQHCRQAGDSDFLADGGFARSDPVRPATAFDWSWSDDGAVGIVIAPAPGFSGKALTVDSTSSRETGFATQAMVLPPGDFAASWRARDGAGKASPDVRLSVTCDKDEPQDHAASLRDARSGQWVAPFTVPADCPVQWLSLRIASGVRTVTVDDVAVTRR